MDKFDQKLDALKTLWQNQKLKDETMDAVIAPDSFVIKRLKTFERVQLRINIIKVTVLIIIMGTIIWYLSSYAQPSPWVLMGLFWMIACLTVFTYLYLRKQFRSNQLNFSLKTSDFIILAINKLYEQKKIFQSIFPFLVIGLIIGINLIYIGVLTDLSYAVRAAYHLSVSIVLAGLIPIGFRIRTSKFKKEYQPVIDELLNFKREIGK